MRRGTIMLLALVFVALVFALNALQVPELAESTQLHCEMVQLWDRSKGELGWPDYNGQAKYCH